MAKVDQYVGNHYHHPTLGKVKVLKRVPNTRTMVEVEVVDRGPGYDHDRRKYIGVKGSTGWTRGQNYQYGHIDETHYKHLKSK